MQDIQEEDKPLHCNYRLWLAYSLLARHFWMLPSHVIAHILSLSHSSKCQLCLRNVLTSVARLEDSNSNIHKVVPAMLQGRLHGIVTCEHHKMQGLKSEAIGWNSDVRKNIALCNDLVPLAKNILAGTLEEKKAFLDVEAIFVVTLLFYLDPEACAGSVHQQAI